MGYTLRDSFITAGPCTLSLGAFIGAPSVIIVGLVIISGCLLFEIFN